MALSLHFFYIKQAAPRPSEQAHGARLALLLRLQRDNSLVVVYLGRCPRLYTAALSAHVACEVTTISPNVPLDQSKTIVEPQGASIITQGALFYLFTFLPFIIKSSTCAQGALFAFLFLYLFTLN